MTMIRTQKWFFILCKTEMTAYEWTLGLQIAKKKQQHINKYPNLHIQVN